jgi:16S rRNA (uracil1498-N3)-methyltransferase
VALASAKQSRRAVLPEVRMPLAFETALGEPPPALRLMMVEPGTSASVEAISALQHLPMPSDAVMFVGPEGGWTAEEWAAAETHGVRLMSLGPRTLRADAVPIAAMAVLQFIWGEA